MKVMNTAREKHARTHSGSSQNRQRRDDEHCITIIAELRDQQIYYDDKLKEVSALYRQEKSVNQQSVSPARRQTDELYSICEETVEVQ